MYTHLFLLHGYHQAQPGDSTRRADFLIRQKGCWDTNAPGFTCKSSVFNIRVRKEKRVIITDDTREDFQTARINDRMNQESDIYADWNSEDDKQVHLDIQKLQATKTDNEESQDHIYNDLEISDLPRLSEADDSEELPNSCLLNRNDTKDGTQTPPHQITGNTSFAQSTASETHENILKASSENLTGLDDVKESLTEDGPKKTISDWMVIETELKYTAKKEYDNDKVQILKRKFSDFIQTKPSPIKVAKVKKG
ncbi:hypothetical protein C2G38_2047856 [Gigaspora rosea]|uniref:Uncharacterized protein n=1 Tax=Gigaspora rosea TaxID=44941 RepID=A0A397U4B7_9GLOM|nr:hypothetical protein C2G38_2047856 [Gigaspora rosea]